MPKHAVKAKSLADIALQQNGTVTANGFCECRIDNFLLCDVKIILVLEKMFLWQGIDNCDERDYLDTKKRPSVETDGL